MTGSHSGVCKKNNNSKNNSTKNGTNAKNGDAGSANVRESKSKSNKCNCSSGTLKKGDDKCGGDSSSWDDHTRWESMQTDEFLQDVWQKRLEDACEAIQIRDPSNGRGMIPEFANRMLMDLKKPQTDWRTILNSFVQEEIADYSFMPPDRRMDDCDFFLPDFNEKEDIVSDILFMIDTSASM